MFETGLVMMLCGLFIALMGKPLFGTMALSGLALMVLGVGIMWYATLPTSV